MSEHYGMFGAAGERQVGKRDVATEANLPMVQGVWRVIIDIITGLAVIVAALDIGRLGVWLATTLLAFMFIDRATEALGRQVRNVRMLALIYGAEVWLPWAWLFGGLVLLRVVLPYAWAFYPATSEHYLVIFRTVDGLPDNIVKAFPLFVRVLILVVCAAWTATAGILRGHFANEIMAFYPMKAIDPSEVSVNPRDWSRNKQPRDSSITVHLETVQRADPAQMGRRMVYPGDTIHIDDMSAKPSQWLALTHVAGVNAKPTEATMLQNGFTQDEWRAFRAQLVAAGLMQQIGNGDHGQNAGYDFTPEGREFFKAKRWERRR